MSRTGRRRIVILGGGFGGAYCAQALQRRLRGLDADVVLIDRHNYFVFHPLLVEAGTGSLEPRHAVVSIRAFLRETTFRMATVTGLDPHRRTVQYRIPDADEDEAVQYDYLVLSPGSVTSLPAVPGLHEFGFQLKTLGDAVALRDRAIEMLELADCNPEASARRAMLHFVVVGANFTGVEVAGEFEMFLRNATRRYRNLSPRDVKVTLVELTDRILRALDADLSRYATERLKRRRVDVRLNSAVARIDADLVTLRSGEVLPARTVVWCAGIAPAPLLAELPFARDDRGYILTERDLRVPGFENVWAIGDCAVNPGPDGKAYPATAQHAVRQAGHAAADIARTLCGRPTRPCNIASAGSLAALGCRTGVAKVGGFKLAGFPAWWLWRSVYLLKMPGTARKLRVAIDWTMDLLFPRDYVQLRVHGRTRAARPAATAKDATRGAP